MPDDDYNRDQSADDIQDFLEVTGAAASPRLLRLKRIAASMQSLEWQLARKRAQQEASVLDDDRQP